MRAKSIVIVCAALLTLGFLHTAGAQSNVEWQLQWERTVQDLLVELCPNGYIHIGNDGLMQCYVAVEVTPTETSVPPSSTPVPTATVVPSETPVATEPSNGPVAGAPKCPDELHDPLAWHGLWNAEHGCHYDHTHNADPREADAVFGPVAQWAGGTQLSYPWQTFNENGTENQLKHEGYKYSINLNANPDCNPDWLNANAENCVTGFRIQHHVVGGAVGANTRLHSYYAEVQVCELDGSNCGIVKTGGWADFGVLHVPYKGMHIPLPGDPPDAVFPNPPYRGHHPADQAQEIANGSNDSDIRYTWNSDDRYGYNKILSFDFRALDDWGGINPNNPTELHLVCPDFQCKFNHSELNVYTVHVRVPADLDTDGDGRVTYSGYTDRMGNIVEGCTEPGLDCVPLVFENAPVGFGEYFERGGPRFNSNGDERYIPDYDISPPGEWWIEYPN